MNYSNQSYTHYSFPFGDTEIVVVSDGPLDMGIPEDSFRGLSKEEIQEQLLLNFLPIDKVAIEQNIPILTLGGKRILFETGIGSLKMFGLHSGRLQFSLQGAGIDPGSIDAIVCSHPHPDHIGGICTDDGAPLFPNAQIYLSENDFSFWTDEKLLGTRLDLLVKTARSNLLPVRDRIVFFKDGQEFCQAYRLCLPPDTRRNMPASS
jgi:glyoxylase-like metal-dependent hydrolase (beta-lactamase superfamily II)